MAKMAACAASVLITLSLMVLHTEGAPGNLCAVRCMINPCDATSCPAFTSGAVCEPNYCNGCTASWTKDGLDVTETCAQSAQAAVAANPTSADVSKPPTSSAQQTSVPVSKGNALTAGVLGTMDMKKLALMALQSQNGDRPCVQTTCMMDPCDVSTCPAFPQQATCTANTCGGCSARWTMDGVDVTRTCIKSVLATRPGGPKRSRFQGQGSRLRGAGSRLRGSRLRNAMAGMVQGFPVLEQPGALKPEGQAAEVIGSDTGSLMRGTSGSPFQQMMDFVMSQRRSRSRSGRRFGPFP